MRSVLLGLWLALVSASISGTSFLQPGYVINYKTPKNQADSHYAFLTVSGIDAANPSDLVIGLNVNSNNPTKPYDEIRLGARMVPDNFSAPPFIYEDDDKKYLRNTTNQVYFISSKANCNNAPGGVGSTCYEDVEGEVSAWTIRNNNASFHWPPYQLLDQRRTAKFDLPYGNWIYFWLTVTDANLDSNGLFALYMGCQFFDDGDDEGVRMSVYNYSAPWPTGIGYPVNVLAIDYYPVDATQKNNWIQSTPTPLTVGIYKVAAENLISGTTTHFTIKVGFNKAPVQAANMNASFHRVGLFTLIALCIVANMKYLL